MMVKQQITQQLHLVLFLVVFALPDSSLIIFDRHRLPWDYTEFSGRSDYGPFLA